MSLLVHYGKSHPHEPPPGWATLHGTTNALPRYPAGVGHPTSFTPPWRSPVDWSLLLLLLVPVWIFLCVCIGRLIVNFTLDAAIDDGSWWGFPLYMATMMPFVLGSFGVLVLIVALAVTL